MKNGLIYMYQNKQNKKVYIGKTIQDFKRRRNDHKIQGTDDDFHKDLGQLGEKSFDIKILEENILQSELGNREYYWFSYYKNDLGCIMYNKQEPFHTKKDGREEKVHSKPQRPPNIVDRLPDTAKLIKGTDRYYADIDGSIYCINSKNKFNKNYGNKEKDVIIKRHFNTVFGYYQCSIEYLDGSRKTKRVNKLIAETFIPNPDNLPVVGHRNNIKTDNRVENLYWTTFSENTQKAVDDGLLKNAKGFDDSQSMPVKMFDTKTNKLLGTYGSASEAQRKTGISMTTILRQAKYKRPVRKPFYFRFIDDKDCQVSCIGMFDYDTNKLLKKFVNASQASKETGVNLKTIVQQIQTGKPKFKHPKNIKNVYFKEVNINKCEQTIEKLTTQQSSESERATSFVKKDENIVD